MTQVQHTPTPWSVEQPNEQTPNLWIVAAGNPGIAKIETCDYDDGKGHRITGEDQANAAFIVKAANSHQALVNALQTIKHSMQQALKPENDRKREIELSLAIAAAALALAESK